MLRLLLTFRGRSQLIRAVLQKQVIGGDPDKDVAVLQLQCPPEKLKDLKPVELGTSANLLVGQKVFAIGNPFGCVSLLLGFFCSLLLENMACYCHPSAISWMHDLIKY